MTNRSCFTPPLVYPFCDAPEGNRFVQVQLEVVLSMSDGGCPCTVGSVAHLLERRTRETQAEQYSETVLLSSDPLFSAVGRIRGRILGGGVEKRRGWKTSRMTPVPKRGFGPPLVRYSFPPLSGVSARTRIHDRADQKLFWRGPKIFERARFSGTFSSPHTFCTPPYHGPTEVTPWQKESDESVRKGGSLFTYSWCLFAYIKQKYSLFMCLDTKAPIVSNKPQL